MAVDGDLLNFNRFVDVVGTDNALKLRVARLRAASGGGKSGKSQVRPPPNTWRRWSCRLAAPASRVRWLRVFRSRVCHV